LGLNQRSGDWLGNVIKVVETLGRRYDIIIRIRQEERHTYLDAAKQAQKSRAPCDLTDDCRNIG